MSRSVYFDPKNPPLSQSGTDTSSASSIGNPGFDNIRLEAVGFVGGLRSHILPVEIVRLEKLGIQLTLSEALKAAIAPAIEGLAIRDLIPDIEFQDVNDNSVQTREWRQPWSGFYSNNSGEFEVYRTNKDVDYDKKVIGIWGVRYVNSGPGRLGNAVNAASITFKDSAGNTYDTWQIEGLDIHPELYAFTPIVFTNTRQLRIFNRPKHSASGGYDNIQLIGKICERRGDNVNGLGHVDVLSTI